MATAGELTAPARFARRRVAGALALLGAIAGLSGCHIIAGFDGLELREEAQPLWSVALAGEGYQTTRALAAQPGAIYALVEHNADLFLDDQALLPQGAGDVALLQLDGAGKLNWMKAIASPGQEYGRALVSTQQGVVMAGVFEGALDIAGTPVQGNSSQSLFIAALSADGEVLSTRTFGGAGFSAPGAKVALAVDAQESLLLGGGFVGEVDFGCGPITAQGTQGAYIAKLDDSGCLWSFALGDSKFQQIESVGVEVGGDVVVAGKFAGTLGFGNATLQSGGGIDAFVAKLNPDGEHRWSHRYGDSGGAVSSVTVAVHPLGNVTLAGYFQGQVDFGAGPVTARQGHDLFVVKLDPNGNHLWSDHFSLVRPACSLDDCELDRIDAVTDIDGNLILTGHFRGDVDFGGTTLVSGGENDLYVVKLDVNGQLLWSDQFGSGGSQCEVPDCVAVAAVDSERNVVLGGGYFGTMRFGTTPLLNDEDGGAFIAKLLP